MIDKEKKDKSIVEPIIIQEKAPVVVVVPELKQPKKKAKKPLTKKDIENDVGSILPGTGLTVVDYSHLYKNFYDIFVGQILEPKTFDLQFVVRDTRNTYA
jgi:hypothetical protein